MVAAITSLLNPHSSAESPVNNTQERLFIKEVTYLSSLTIVISVE